MRSRARQFHSPRSIANEWVTRGAWILEASMRQRVGTASMPKRVAVGPKFNEVRRIVASRSHESPNRCCASSGR